MHPPDRWYDYDHGRDVYPCWHERLDRSSAYEELAVENSMLELISEAGSYVRSYHFDEEFDDKIIVIQRLKEEAQHLVGRGAGDANAIANADAVARVAAVCRVRVGRVRRGASPLLRTACRGGGDAARGAARRACWRHSRGEGSDDDDGGIGGGGGRFLNLLGQRERDAVHNLRGATVVVRTAATPAATASAGPKLLGVGGGCGAGMAPPSFRRRALPAPPPTG